MALEDIEVDIGGNKVRGVWLAILLTAASSIGGGIYAWAEFIGRLDQLEQSVADAGSRADIIEARFGDLKEQQTEALQAMQVSVSKMQTQLQDNDVAGLSAKLSELGTNLAQIMQSQRDLMPLVDRVAAVEKSNSETVLTINGKIEAVDANKAKVDRQAREIEDLWAALDSLFGT